ncbi:MAG: serine/threonine-protein phosphatase [bacterium]|nr:serine/threonine-protein phosphatase [bacterium]
MELRALRRKVKTIFLSEFKNDSFVIQQKAYVLIWLILLTIPVMSIITIINHLILQGSLYIKFISIDVTLLVVIFAGLVLLRKGKYKTAVTMITIVLTILAILSCWGKFDYIMKTGSISPILLMFVVIVFVSLFGSRLLLSLISLLFGLTILILLTCAVILYPGDAVDIPGIGISSGLSLFTIYIFSFLLSRITEFALQKTEELNLSLEQKVKKRTEALEAAKRIADQDMYMASNVQSSLFPKDPPESSEWDIAFSFQPMSGVSGDLYDFYEKEGQLRGLTLCDVSGHGVASGLITMIARSVIHRNFAQGEKNPLDCILEKINRELIEEIGKLDNYLTGIILRFYQGRVEYVNAGHPSILLKHAGTGTVEKIDARDRDFKGCLLGLKSIQLPFGIISFDMAHDDTLLLYSDGLTENLNKKNEMFEKQLPGLFNQAPAGSAEEILEYILQCLNDFMGNTEIRDDITVLVVRKR